MDTVSLDILDFLQYRGFIVGTIVPVKFSISSFKPWIICLQNGSLFVCFFVCFDYISLVSFYCNWCVF